jgi:hypothetical protein
MQLGETKNFGELFYSYNAAGKFQVRINYVRDSVTSRQFFTAIQPNFQNSIILLNKQ